MGLLFQKQGASNSTCLMWTPGGHVPHFLCSAVAQLQGSRDYQEDRVVSIENFNELIFLDGNSDGVRRSYFAVFDGHGGSYCSNRMCNEFAQLIAGHPLVCLDPCRTLSECWLEMEQLLLSGILAIQAEKKLDRPPSDGSTATVGLIIEDTIFVANCGDSTCEGFLRDVSSQSSVTLTRCHNTSNPDEVARVQASASGSKLRQNVKLRARDPPLCFLPQVKKVGKPRLYPGGLLVTRSFGDFHAKRGKQGVSSALIVDHSSLTAVSISTLRFVVLASDGVWDALTADQVGRICGAFASGVGMAEMEEEVRNHGSKSFNGAHATVRAMEKPSGDPNSMMNLRRSSSSSSSSSSSDRKNSRRVLPSSGNVDDWKALALPMESKEKERVPSPSSSPPSKPLDSPGGESTNTGGQASSTDSSHEQAAQATICTPIGTFIGPGTGRLDAVTHQRAERAARCLVQAAVNSDYWFKNRLRSDNSSCVVVFFEPPPQTPTSTRSGSARGSGQRLPRPSQHSSPNLNPTREQRPSTHSGSSSRQGSRQDSRRGSSASALESGLGLGLDVQLVQLADATDGPANAGVLVMPHSLKSSGGGSHNGGKVADMPVASAAAAMTMGHGQRMLSLSETPASALTLQSTGRATIRPDISPNGAGGTPSQSRRSSSSHGDTLAI